MSIAATRQPPAVRYPFAPSRVIAWTLASIALAGTAVMLAWWQAQQAVLAQIGVGAAVWSLANLLAWRWWRAAPSGELAWDGSGWRLRIGEGDDEPSLPPFVGIDLQSGLGVRLARVEGGACWVWLARERAPSRWLDLRRALFAHQDERLRAVNHLTEAEAA